MKKLTLLAAVCCFVLASCGGGNGDSPSAPVLKMNEYVKAGDYEKAMKYWVDNTDFSGSDKSKEELASQTTQLVTMFSAKIKAEAEKHGGIKSFEITSETIGEDGATAEVEGLTTYHDGETDDQNIDMVKVDGKWMFRNEK